MKETSRRIGWFTVGFEEADRWKDFLPVMSRFFIVRCDADYSTRAFVYVAYSDVFDEVKQGCAPPRYDLVFITDKNKKVHLKSVARSLVQGGLYL